MTRERALGRGIRAGVRRLFRLPLRTPAIARADADAELDAFLAERIEHLVRRGMTPAEARDEALRRLGGSLTEVRDALRRSAERREGRMRLRDRIDDVRQDLRYAVRGLTRQRGFTAAAVLCAAIGIGANTTMFGVIDALLLRPPAGVRDAGGLLWVSAERKTELGFTGRPGVSYLDYLDFGRSPVLAGAAAYFARARSFGHGTDAREVNTLTITHTFMPLLGVRPALGRFFSADEDAPGGSPVVILGYAFWRDRFSGAASVIGKSVRIGTKLYTVVGVAPRDFNGVERARVDLYLPMTAGVSDDMPGRADELFTNRGMSWLTVLARLRPGARRERLAAELDAIYHRTDHGGFGRAKTHIVVASPTAIAAMRNPQQVQNATVSLWLAGVAGIVLLIACANVASLLLTRAVRRRREIAVRLALGIGRGRLVRLLMTESLVLAGLGGVAGLLVARWGGGTLRSWLLADVAVGTSVLDPRVLAVTLIATVFTGAVCGLVPALQATRPDLTTALKAGARGGSDGRGRVLGGLLVGQVALTLVLLVGAGLFVRSLQNLRSLDLGFDVQPVLVARARLRTIGYTPAQGERFFRRLLERARTLPGVERAALATAGPFGNGQLEPVFVPGREPERGLPPAVSYVTSEFFATVGMALRSGRVFTDADRAGTERVAVVNEEMARLYWPAGDALGKCIEVGSDTMPCTTVVGIVETARAGNIVRQPVQDERPMPGYYLPLDQSNAARTLGPMLYVRTSGDAVRLVPLIRHTMEAMAPDLPVPDVTAFSTALAPQFRPWRLGVVMCGIFGAVALALAMIGLYGVLAFGVSQRTHEIGVRIALGARRDDVRRLVVGQGLRLGALGVAIGIGAALAAGQLLAALLFGVSPRDPVVLAMASGAVLIVVVLASYLPARRATRIDPMEALREL
ncbi:MAG TPA: ABC transporter permease [Gemmatimonadaceae bacterium]